MEFQTVKRSNNTQGKMKSSLNSRRGGGGRLLPYVAHVGFCGPKGYGLFSCYGLK